MSEQNRVIEEDKANSIKIILVGDSGTGKTNLIAVSAGMEFNSNSLTTTSCSYVQKIINKDGKDYKINLWDTIGQEKYRSLTKIFLKDSKIVIFVYDITNRETFESLVFWKKIIDEVLGNEPIFGVVGNKMDLYYEEKVKEEEGEEYANSIGAKFLLFSAKTENPKKIEQYLAELVEEYLTKRDDNDDNINGRITLSKKVASRENKKHKCLKCSE